MAKSSKRGLSMTLEQAQAHAAKHGYALQPYQKATILGAEGPIDLVAGSTERQMTLPKPVKMTRPEREYGLILEAMKRRNDIVDYRFQGMSLAWGEDPKTGRLMRYKCDWLVIGERYPGFDYELNGIKLVEVKGARIWPQDMIRFKGCRAAWPSFTFEMHQLSGGVWSRVA